MPLDCDMFHASWIATVLNLDWPSKLSSGIEDDEERVKRQKQELMRLFDEASEHGINAVIFQVSPAADAFYKSDYLPWSSYLTGRLGKYPGFDPLQFAITEARKRDIELHAWLNPYRVSMDDKPVTAKALKNSSSDSPLSIFKTRPEWIGVSAGRYVLDPGIPAVREWVTNITAEVVRKYDIDGIQFDDYFYYETSGSPLEDDTTFARFGTSFTSKYDWRRYNTYTLVQEISQKIRSIKPNVRFGISPGGVWRNGTDDPLGSPTQAGKTNYDGDFADTRRWVKDGLIDYIAPQVYWSFGRKQVPYGPIVRWWADTVRGTKTDLYIGMALYRAGTKSRAEPDWQAGGGVDEIRRQLEFNASVPEVKGSILFRQGFLSDPGLKKVSQYLKRSWGKCIPPQ
ncbi:glycoside hydrolase family 10 protein [Falsochrobactrum sp. TDYN1]|uniref:Glycoside hydrolase family 10 protein n=1 Tax=Falsochrobactrum tianjinense TaxID=2706015 RepID=A0A949PPY2_9HYPH|nr:glycoside hydrolase family 10 protein [Falsochrobactrum sp. TDYN1]MBV2143876.1 glycoside hydrolase family 10 protein [Falsochrobactrum sp. TDYN1]